MKRLLKVYIMVVATITLSPIVAFAQADNQTCSSGGYTVETINGVLTNEDGAVANKRALELLFNGTYKGEKLTFDFLLNPTHLYGVGDAFKVVIQKFFQDETVKDYDLAQMFIDANQKVKTQKLLLVAHSQGNFYANSFYDIAIKEGRVLPQSLGVYAVASPSNHLAKKVSGLWLTSDTDHVIAGLVDGTVGGIVPPNLHIAEVARDTDPFSGHDFSGVYLKYAPNQVVAGVNESLRRLSNDPSRNPNASCITPPPSIMYSLLYKTESGAFFVIDSTLEFPSRLATVVKQTATYVANGATNFFVTFVNIVTDVSSSIYAKMLLLTLGTDSISSNSNSASVILATQPEQKSNSVLVNKNQMTVVAVPVNQSQPLSAPAQSQPQTVFVFEPKVQTGANAPKLVFVGSFSGGSSQILGTQAIIPVEEEVKTSGGGAGTAMAVPALSAPQCEQTLATDGCLLATTTVHFEWSAIEGADHYLINKNGEYATTTEKSFDIEIKDFLDYIFEVVAVSVDGTSSATSTQAVSVATIPIAINEIAWMGTVADDNDEWFEIKNNTKHTIDISKWELSAKDGTPHIKLKGTIGPKEYLIFERTDDNVVKDIKAHATTTGAFNNNPKGEQLNLSYASTTYDQTPEGAWVAGYNSTTTRKTMERYSSREPGIDPTNWGTNLGYIKNGTDAKNNAIEGTPGKQNSVSTLINKGKDITSDFTLTADEERYVIANTLRVSASSTLTVEPGVEIKFYGGGIQVEGQLVVSGTPENPVFISSIGDNPAGKISVGGGWVNGVYQGRDAFASFDNTKIENIDGIVVNDRSRLEISHTDLLGISNGIYSNNQSQIHIASSAITGTLNNHAVAAYMDSRVTIASSTITNNLDNDAIGVYHNAVMTISSTTIDGVPDGNGISVYGRNTYGGTLFLSGSTIKNVDGSGIYVYKATSTISNTMIENAGRNGIANYDGKTTITDTIISGVSGGDGVYVGGGLLSIASSTIKNVTESGINLYNATSTISNVTIENGGWDGIYVYKGTATITDTNVSGFADGAGIVVDSPLEPVVITGGEVTNNGIGVLMGEGEAFLSETTVVHDNDEDILVW